MAVVVADGCEVAVQLLKKLHPFDVNGSKRFERQWSNVYVSCRSTYLFSFLVAAFSAAPPAFADVRWRYESAMVLVTVTSHVTLFSRGHGMNVSPSGRFPSVRESSGFSRRDGLLALDSARYMMSLS